MSEVGAYLTHSLSLYLLGAISRVGALQRPVRAEANVVRRETEPGLRLEASPEPQKEAAVASNGTFGISGKQTERRDRPGRKRRCCWSAPAGNEAMNETNRLAAWPRFGLLPRCFLWPL